MDMTMAQATRFRRALKGSPALVFSETGATNYETTVEFGEAPITEGVRLRGVNLTGLTGWTVEGETVALHYGLRRDWKDGELVDLTDLARVDLFVTIPVGSVDAQRSMRAIAEAASKDDTLPLLTAAQVEVADGRVTIAATDRYRLVEAEMHGLAVRADGSALVAGRLLAELKTVKDGVLTVGEDRSAVLTDGMRISTANVLGEFPRVRKLWPEKAEPVATIDPAKTVRMLKDLGVDKKDFVGFGFDNDGTQVWCDGSDAHALPGAEPGAEPYTVHFTSGLLAGLLKALGAKAPKVEVRAVTVTTMKPMVFNVDGGLRFLLMPVARPGFERPESGVAAAA